MIGGLNSCTLVLMISAFFNTCPPLPTVGHLFLELLRYYGYVFRNDQMVIAEGEYIVPHNEPNAPLDDLRVMDLFQPNLNASANVIKFGEIRALFKKVYESIQNGESVDQ